MNHIDNILPIFGYGLFTFMLFILIEPFFYKLVIRLKLGKTLREEAASGGVAKIFRRLHKKKQGIPTMGGMLIWGTVLLTVIFSRFLSYKGYVPQSVLSRNEVYVPLFTLISMGFLGAIDDWFNIKGIGKKKGIDVTPKFFLLTIFATLGAWWFDTKLGYDTLHIPFYGDLFINLLSIPINIPFIGYFIVNLYMLIFILVIISTANAVNITDGLDGLAGGLLIISFTSYGAIAYFKGKFILAIFCGIIDFSLLGFLWYNIPPAKFFMGDTGSLALGATLGIIALMLNSLLVLPLIGGVFVLETLSVILQVTSKKLRNGKKIFNIAPLHHHFESIGWTESQIVMRLWMIGSFLAFLGVIIEFIGT